MEKVKITQEQANDIKSITSLFDKSDLLARQAKADPWDRYKTLNKLSLDEMARALYVGYEVELEFKEGDWIYREWDGKVSQITKIDHLVNKRWVICTDIYPVWLIKDEVRHATAEEIATEKQRRWWARHDRDVWSLDLYDCVINKYGAPFVVMGVTDDYLKNGTSYELSNGTEYPKDDMEPFFKVLYFAEDRKDIN